MESIKTSVINPAGKRLGLILPPLVAQSRIVALMEGLQTEFDRLAALQQKTTTKVDALFPSILDKALKGDL